MRRWMTVAMRKHLEGEARNLGKLNTGVDIVD